MRRHTLFAAAALFSVVLGVARAVAQPAPASEPAPLPQLVDPSSEATDCAAGWVPKLYQGMRSAVVRIEIPGGLAAGFLFHSPSHVATAFHVIEQGRDVTVVTTTGERIPAAVVAVNGERDLAILELERPIAGVAPLPLAPDDVALGSGLMIIGHPYATEATGELEGLLSWSLSVGIVSGAGRHLIQTDAAVNPGNSGGPALDCLGRVLGVMSMKLSAEGIGFLVRARDLAELEQRIGEDRDFHGTVELKLLLGAIAHMNAEEALLGLDYGLRVQFFDVGWVGLRHSLLFDIDPVGAIGPDVTSYQTLRNQLELGGGFRFLVVGGDLPLHIGPGFGAVVARDVRSSEHIAVRYVDAACQPPACTLAASIEKESSARWFGWPVVALDFTFGDVMDLSYGFMPDVTDFRLSVHRVRLGMAL